MDTDRRLLAGRAVPMAITAEALRDLRERLSAAASPAFMAALAKGEYRAEEPDGAVPGTGGILRVDDGVGVISVNGPLFKGTGGIDDAMLSFFGCTSYDDIWRAVEACREQGLQGAMLRMNSPGGDAAGPGELADFFWSLRADGFPVWTYCETQCASAAVWIASQTEKMIAHETAFIGWIGVIRGPLFDDSKLLEKAGLKPIEIVSKHAKAKRTVPLDDEVLERFQVMVDDLGDCFEADVARGRGVSSEEVAERFGGGTGLIAQKALDAGLIDELGTFNSALEAFREHLAAPPATIASAPKPAARAQAQVNTTGDLSMATKAEAEPKEPESKNKGKAKAEEEPMAEMEKCEKCGGSGKNADGAECKHCEGTGEIEKAEGDGGEDGAKSKAEHEEPDGDEEKHEGKKALAALSGLRVSASIAAHAAAIEAKRVPRSQVTTLESRVNAMEAERKAEKQAEENAKLSAIADRAGELGYFAGLDDAKAKAKRERFIKIARNEPDAAEEIIASLPAARVTGRVTSQGNPTSGRHSGRRKIDAFEDGASGGVRRVSHGDVDTLEKGSPDLMARARAIAAEQKVSIDEAMVRAVKADPSLMRG